MTRITRIKNSLKQIRTDDYVQKIVRQVNLWIINGNSCSKYTVNPCAKSILCSNKNGGWD